MKTVLRVLSFVVGLVLFLWSFSHAGGFHPDGTPVDPNPPPFILLFCVITVAVVLWLFAVGFFQVMSAPARIVGDGTERSGEQTSLASKPSDVAARDVSMRTNR